MGRIQGVILDIDGTLLESNDAHAHAWVEALADNGYDVPFDEVRPLIGMGGDKVLPEVIGVQKDSDIGKQIDQRRDQIFKDRYLPHIKPTPGAKELLRYMRERGLKLAVASSSQKDQLKSLLQILDATDLIKEETSSSDAQHSKPSAQPVEVTLKRTGFSPQSVVMLGDTAYDIESAQKVGVRTIALRCGGSSDKDLSGAIAIYDDPADLLRHFDASVLGA
jgi:phosphoglycolate phosphatase-like HAD superfamily hydrolase